MAKALKKKEPKGDTPGLTERPIPLHRRFHRRGVCFRPLLSHDLLTTIESSQEKGGGSRHGGRLGLRNRGYLELIFEDFRLQ